MEQGYDEEDEVRVYEHKRMYVYILEIIEMKKMEKKFNSRSYSMFSCFTLSSTA